MSRIDWGWSIKMAYRDSRKSLGRLFFYFSAIILAVSSIVAITSFKQSFLDKIDSEARELLGADMVVYSYTGFDEKADSVLRPITAQQTEDKSFASMVSFTESDFTRLVWVKAIDKGFPILGEIECTPATAIDALHKGEGAIIDASLLLQAGLKVGDSLVLGTEKFQIAGTIEKAPGQVGVASMVAPVVFIPLEKLAATGLEQVGSRIITARYLTVKRNEAKPLDFKENIKWLTDNKYRVEEVNDRKTVIGNSFNQLNDFMNIIAIASLLIGSIGIAGAIAVYANEKMRTAVVLKCMGAAQESINAVFLIQVSGMSFLAGVVAVLLGVALQSYFPVLLAQFLPTQLELALSFSAMLGGIATGMVVTLLFAYLPFSKLSQLSAAQALRDRISPIKTAQTKTIIVYAFFVLFIGFVTYLLTENVLRSVLYVAAIGLITVVLLGIGNAFKLAIKKLPIMSLPFSFRLGLSNTSRPGNQSNLLIISIGLGIVLIAVLFNLRQMLTDQLQISTDGDRPNMLLFDIQQDQVEGVHNFVAESNMPVLQQVPIVAMRLEAINGRRREEIKADTTSKIPAFALDREYRVTYRDTLIESETLVDGTLEKNDSGVVYISLEEKLAEQMMVKVGDKITFNIQGLQKETTIGSIRKVDWNRVQTNFTVVFQTGLIESAPKTYVIATKSADKQQSAIFQRNLIKRYPTVSVIDIETILKTANEVLDQIAFVINFMTGLCLLTGILILITGINLTRFQKIKEFSLLRTMGMLSKQLNVVYFTEYASLGFIAALSGVLFSTVLSIVLAKFVFNSWFIPSMLQATAIIFITAILTAVVGSISNIKLLRQPPMQILRDAE